MPPAFVFLGDVAQLRSSPPVVAFELSGAFGLVRVTFARSIVGWPYDDRRSYFGRQSLLAHLTTLSAYSIPLAQRLI
jgi:hypothetical protein